MIISIRRSLNTDFVPIIRAEKNQLLDLSTSLKVIQSRIFYGGR